MNKEFEYIHSLLYPETLAFVIGMNDGTNTEDSGAYLGDMRLLADCRLIWLRETFNKSELTPKGKEFVAWVKEHVITD